MLAQRIALLAARLGIPLPRIAGQTRLGLLGTVRITEPVPLIFTQRGSQNIAEVDAGLNLAGLIEGMNSSNVWTWIETRDGDGKWRWPEYGSDPAVLAQCSKGDIGSQDFSLILTTERWALRCVPARDGLSITGLLVLGVLKPRRAPYARLLVASFAAGPNVGFDTAGMFGLVASQTRLHVHADQVKLEREESVERDFITMARRHLEALRNHAVTSTPRASYEIIDPSPLRLRTLDGDAWPRAFTLAGTRLQVPTRQAQFSAFSVVDVSDDGDVLTLDGDANENTLVERGELKMRPNDDGLRRMREALDTIAMGIDEAHARLLTALTRPESLPDLVISELTGSDEQSSRQKAATNLALQTPDIALIHGPPGTGKTTVICNIVEELVRRGQRVLLVAPTHVALDNVLERVGKRTGVTAIRLGSPDNVEEQAHRFLLQNRSRDLAHRLATALQDALAGQASDDPVEAVQREWAERIRDNEEIGALLLLNANLVCATPIGIAMARGFREVDVIFDVMILDEASKATITDFLVPAARAKKWILVGDHRQLAPYVDLGELEAVVSERAKRAEVVDPPEGWTRELSTRIRQHFDNRMHPNLERVVGSWRDLVRVLGEPFKIDDATFDLLLALGPTSVKWRDAHRAALSVGIDEAGLPFEGLKAKHASILRLGAEMLELQQLALPSVFEHLTRLPSGRKMQLNYQHRMTPRLAEFSSEMVYAGDYPSARETKALGIAIPGLEGEAIWIDTAYSPSARRYEYPRDQDWSGGDYTNELEVEVAVELVEMCAAWAVQSWHGDPRGSGRGAEAPFEIGVVSFYLKQAQQLSKAIFLNLTTGSDRWRRRWPTPAANGSAIDIHVSIVDRFQGREKDLIILCTTRSNPIGRCGHVDNLNRLNVAVTRARHKRIVIGDSTTLAGQEGGRKRQPDDLLRRLYELSDHKKKWGRALGGRP